MAAQTNQGAKTKKGFSLGNYLKETKYELKKVIWPTKKQALKDTGVVLTVVVSSTILVWILDSAFSGALKLILK